MVNTSYTKAPEYLSRSVRHLAAVTARIEGGEEIAVPVDADGAGLEVTMSEDWSPYCQARITLPVPLDAGLLDTTLDPRRRVRLRITAGYAYPDGTAQTALLADVGLRERPVTRPAGKLTLDGGGDEYLAQDDKAFWIADLDRRGINEAVSWLAQRIEPARAAPAVRSDFPARHGAPALADLGVGIGEEHWAVMSEAAARTGAKVWCDEAGVWRITRRQTAAGEPVHRLAVGAGGTITESTANLTREPWANAVVLRYRWRDAAGQEQMVWGRAAVSSGPYDVDQVGFKTHVEDIERPVTPAAAHMAAATKLRSLITRGRARTLTAAAAYWLRPGDTVAVVLPTGGEELHLIQSVTFTPLNGLMRVVTRQPLDIEITNGE